MYAASHSGGPSVIMTARSTAKLKLYSLYLLHGTARSAHLSTAMCCQKFREKNNLNLKCVSALTPTRQMECLPNLFYFAYLSGKRKY